MRAHVKLCACRADGSRLIDHINSALSQGQNWPRGTDKPDESVINTTIWAWYFELRNANVGQFKSTEPISFTEIKAWSSLRTIEIGSIELMLLRVLDQAYLAAVSEIK